MEKAYGDPEHYLERARALAGEGEFRPAIREVLLAGLSWTERKGLIRFRRGLTNRNYLRVLRREGTARESLAGIVLQFEEIYFGRRVATAERFQQCFAQFQAGFSEQK